MAAMEKWIESQYQNTEKGMAWSDSQKKGLPTTNLTNVLTKTGDSY